MTALPNLPEPAPPPADELYAGLPNLPDDVDREIVDDLNLGVDRKDRWQINDDAVAEWAMAKLAEAQGDDADLRAQRDAQMERAQAWYARVSKAAQRTAGFMRAHLEDYALRRRQATGAATLVLPNGEVPTVKGADPCVDVADEAAVLEWAQKHAPEVVTVKRSVKLTDLRTVATAKGDKVVSRDGEVIPGTFVRPAGDPYVPSTGPKPY
jgi:Bacteriophage Mu Gam like protein